jgi:hypothetical protein
MRLRAIKTFLLVGSIFGIATLAYYGDKDKKERSPASAQPKKLWVPAPIGKHLALVKVDISALDFVPESGDGEVTLLGRLTLTQKPTTGLNYRWHLPPDVQIVNGLPFAENLNVEPGQVFEVEIRVRGFNKESQKRISLQAYAKRGGQTLGASALLVSRPEDTYEASAPSVREAVENSKQEKSQLPRGL